MQNTRFVLAEVKTEATVTRTFIDRAIQVMLDGKMDAVQASNEGYSESDQPYSHRT